MKRTRTNHAPEFETMEAMDAAVTLDEAMTAFLQEIEDNDECIE